MRVLSISDRLGDGHGGLVCRFVGGAARIKRRIPLSEEVITRFDQMDISAEVLKAIDKMGFKEPSTVQAKTIP